MTTKQACWFLALFFILITVMAAMMVQAEREVDRLEALVVSEQQERQK